MAIRWGHVMHVTYVPHLRRPKMGPRKRVKSRLQMVVVRWRVAKRAAATGRLTGRRGAAGSKPQCGCRGLSGLFIGIIPTSVQRGAFKPPRVRWPCIPG